MQVANLSRPEISEKSFQTECSDPAFCQEVLRERLARFEAEFSDEDVDANTSTAFARSVQNQIPDQFRKF